MSQLIIDRTAKLIKNSIINLELLQDIKYDNRRLVAIRNLSDALRWIMPPPEKRTDNGSDNI